MILNERQSYETPNAGRVIAKENVLGQDPNGPIGP